MRPVFCISRRMRADAFSRRFREGRKMSLKLSMQHIQGSKQPLWRPVQEDLDHANHVLELFFYRKDLRTSDDPDLPDVRTAETLRRQRGEALRQRCRGAGISFTLSQKPFPNYTNFHELLYNGRAQPCSPEVTEHVHVNLVRTSTFASSRGMPRQGVHCKG